MNARIHLTEDEEKQLIEDALRGARPPMAQRLGHSVRGFDAADEIAEGIARGIKRGLIELGLREEQS